MALDLAISLGPACATAFNLRRYTGVRRAFPFDWWITPLHAAVAAIESRFELALEPGNLEVTTDRHSVLNRAFDLLHHHDFRRVCGSVAPLDAAEIAALSSKVAHLGGRFLGEVAAAREVGLFLGEVMAENRYTRQRHDPRDSCRELFRVVERTFPRTRFRLFVADPGPLAELDERVVPLAYRDLGDRWNDEPDHFAGSPRGWDEALRAIGLAAWSGGRSDADAESALLERGSPGAVLGPAPGAAELRSLAARRPEDVAVLRELAAACGREGCRAEALTVIGRAVALAPRDVELRHREAQLLADLGRAGEAHAAAATALALDPANAWSHFKLSEMLLRLDRPAAALAHAERAVALAPRSAKLAAHLARLAAVSVDASAVPA